MSDTSPNDPSDFPSYGGVTEAEHLSYLNHHTQKLLHDSEKRVEYLADLAVKLQEELSSLRERQYRALAFREAAFNEAIEIVKNEPELPGRPPFVTWFIPLALSGRRIVAVTKRSIASAIIEASKKGPSK